MKKIFTLILALVMLLTLLCSCGKKEDTSAADTYLSMAQEFLDKNDLDSALDILNKGFSETNDSRISEKIIEIYAQRDNNKDTQPTATEPTSTTPVTTEPPATNPPATTPAATNPPATTPPATNPPATTPIVTEPAHTHSYSSNVTAPTCTDQGYTTYTCSCGDSYVDDYINPSHAYSNYVCSKCGAVDKAHAYDYLVLYIKQNGTTSGTQTIIKEVSQEATIELLYDAQVDAASLMLYFTSNNQFFFSQMYLDNYYYYTKFDDCKVTGYLDAKSFTENSALSYSNYEGSNSNKQDIIDLARFSCCDMLDWLSGYLPANNIGITIADLGFTSYETTN